MSEQRVVFAVGASGQYRSNGPSSSFTVSLTLTENGDGLYPVVDSATMAQESTNGAPAATWSVTAGTLQVDPLASTSEASMTASGQLSVRVDDGGRYHVSTIEPLTLICQAEIGVGIPDSPHQIDSSATTLRARPTDPMQ